MDLTFIATDLTSGQSGNKPERATPLWDVSYEKQTPFLILSVPVILTLAMISETQESLGLAQ
jgi:hypothetical protein